MSKIFKVTTAAMLLVLTNNAFASAKNDMSMTAGPCVHLRCPTSCTSYPTGECFWDYADQRCESRRNFEDSCSRYSYQRCINSGNCFWDQDDQRCEHRG